MIIIIKIKIILTELGIFHLKKIIILKQRQNTHFQGIKLIIQVNPINKDYYLLLLN